MEDANVGFATSHDDLFPLKAPEGVPNLLLLAQVEVVFLECCGVIAQTLLDFPRQRALLGNRPLKGHDDRNSEMAKETDVVPYVRCDSGTKVPIHLRQKKSLDVDYQSAAMVRDNAFRHEVKLYH